MYGPPGSGKSFSTLLFAEGLAKVRKKRIAYVDTEHGTDFYAQAVKIRQVHPEAFDFDALYTRSLSEVIEAVEGLDPKKYGVIVIDSISHMWEAAIDAYEGKRTKIDTIPMHAWGTIKKPYKRLVKFLLECPMDVFILGRQKNLFETDAITSEVKHAGVGMKAEGETAYEPHICFRMASKQDPKDPNSSNYFLYAEKDRTGVLSGRTMVNPSFATIEPLLALLGNKQASMDDDDERQAKDSELMVKDAEKRKKKEEKSKLLLAEFNAQVTACTEIAELGLLGDEIKKKRRYMVEEDTAALRVMYEAKRDSLVKAAVVEV